MAKDNITTKDVLEALKLYNNTNIELEDVEHTKSLMKKKLTLEEVLRVASIIVYPTNTYNMKAIKDISVANIIISKLVEKVLILEASLNDRVPDEKYDEKTLEKKLEQIWEDAEKDYDSKNEEEKKKLAETLGKKGEESSAE